MERVTEITVFLENQSGSLARLAQTLGERGINILGFTLTNALDHGSLRMVVSSPTDALHLFGEHNLLALEHDILMVRLKNAPGALTELGNALSKGGVDIEYAYGSAGAASNEATTLFLRVSDVDRAIEILNGTSGVE